MLSHTGTIPFILLHIVSLPFNFWKVSEQARCLQRLGAIGKYHTPRSLILRTMNEYRDEKIFNGPRITLMGAVDNIECSLQPFPSKRKMIDFTGIME